VYLEGWIERKEQAQLRVEQRQGTTRKQKTYIEPLAQCQRCRETQSTLQLDREATEHAQPLAHCQRLWQPRKKQPILVGRQTIRAYAH
jgi:hypothetical protein